MTHSSKRKKGEECGMSMKIGYETTLDGINIPQFGICITKIPCPIHDANPPEVSGTLNVTVTTTTLSRTNNI